MKLFGRERYRHSGWLDRFVYALNAGIRLEKIKIVLQTLRGAMSGLQLVAISHIDMEKVTRVCRQARIWDDIARMPMGLHTLDDRPSPGYPQPRRPGDRV